MNFYDFHIGDYASRTAHLEPMEDLGYRRLLDLYYVREEALPADVGEVARLIRLRGQEAVVQAVLDEFFRLGPNGWTHDKCEAVIAAAVDKRNKARASAAQRWGTASAMPTQCDRTANAMPTESEGNAPSPIPSPIPKKKDSGAVALLIEKGIPEDLARDFNAIRKAKRAPLTATAIVGIEREAAKAGLSLEQALRECCARGWQSFKADWQTTNGKAAPTATTPTPANADAALRKLDADKALTKGPSAETRAQLAAIRQGAH